MKQFIELTRDGVPVSINISHIKYFTQGEDGKTLLYLFDEEPYFFKIDEKYDKIKSLIDSGISK